MEGWPVLADTWVPSGFETGPGRNQAIKGVTTPNLAFSGHNAQLIPHPTMDVSAPHAGASVPLTIFARTQMA